MLKHTFLLATIFTCGFFFRSNAASINRISDSSEVIVKVIDVTTTSLLTDYQVVISNTQEAVSWNISKSENLFLHVDASFKYLFTVHKTDYHIVTVPWSPNSASVRTVVEVYLLPEKCSGKELRRAYKHSRHLPQYPCYHCGGFKAIKAPLRMRCVYRIVSFYANGETGTSYSFSRY